MVICKSLSIAARSNCSAAGPPVSTSTCLCVADAASQRSQQRDLIMIDYVREELQARARLERGVNEL
jgi:hypothetical protein